MSTQNVSSVSTEKPWTNEFNRRMLAFSTAIKMDVESVMGLFKKLGIDSTEEDCLTLLDSELFLPASDIFKTFVDEGHAPIARVRMGIAHLRGQTSLEEPKPTLNGDSGIMGGVTTILTKLVEQGRRVEDLTVEELLERYDEQHPEAIERLSRLSHGRPCIILNADGTVNVHESTKMVKTAMKQATSDRHIISGKVVRVWRAGTEFMVKPLDESPFYRNVALVNGVCARSGTDWNEVEQDARVLVRIYVHDVESASLNKMLMKQLNQDAKQGVDSMREKYPEAAMRFDELKELGQLPTLKVSHRDMVIEPSGRKDTGF